MRDGVLMRRATYAAVLVAVALIGLKGGAFILTGSLAMLATLFDSMLDMAASVLNLFAVRAALTPADREHRFGHGKAEAMAGLGQAAIIVLSAVYIVFEAIERLLTPSPVTESAVGVIVTVIAIALTLGLVAFQTKVVRETNSLAIAADSIHYKGDLLMNLAVIAALVLSVFPGFSWADPVFGLLIAAFIVLSAVAIVREAVRQLMDHEMPEEDRERIRAIVLADKDVVNMHDLRTRMAGNQGFIQFHLELDGGMTLDQAHVIADRVELAVQKAFPGSEVISHQDPVGAEHITAFERT
ncbi:MAG: cation diffusion facilitator family transporter [Alphaproteobacteria bacterium]|nr:cation diffusion facilitator family transporter [Alphaproteobacteria bacterium]MBO6628025.1 cation diffusion facilitator family transporter [Alphaproteobacteria bacterium]MDF1625595.1 cation diffusion facilitator family transporter [Parvibaculaceae bacterium]